jgi:integrase
MLAQLPAILAQAAPTILSGDLLDQRLAKAAHDARGADAPNTVRTYGAGVRSFVAWCDGAGIPYALPVAPDILAAYVDGIGKALAPASVNAYVSAIDRMHRDLDLPPPGAAQVVRLAKRRLRREKGTAQKQARPMGFETITPVLDAMGDSLPDLRDAALIALAYDTLARASEMVALNVSDIREHAGNHAAYIARSKTDQEGAGQFRFVAPDTAARVAAWVSAARLEGDNPLFLPLSHAALGERLSTRDISRIFKRRVGSSFSAHSTRVGAAVDQLTAKEDTARIMQAGGWKSPVMVARYTMQADAQNSAAASLARKQGRVR